MIKKAIFFLLVLGSVISANGQTLQDLLYRIETNNPEILAYGKLLEARKLEAMTGLTPPDPEIAGGYLPGKPGIIGTKKTWSVSQRFDFPSKYILQKKVNRNTLLLAEYEFRYGKLLTMLDGEITFFELIYTTKALKILKTRKEGLVLLQSAWRKMLDHRETTILDYNKIIMEISVNDLEIARYESAARVLKEKLIFMCGGDSLLPGISDYPSFDDPGIEKLISEKSLLHPAFLIPEIEYQTSLQEVKLSRTGSLPGFEVGYTSEIVPGQTYSGPYAGIRIPLWENANKVRYASAVSDHSAALRDAELLRLKSGIKRDYSNMQALKNSLTKIREMIMAGEGSKYADIALQSGEISINDYFNYLELNYQSEERALELEYEYYRSLASLLDHRLIKQIE